MSAPPDPLEPSGPFQQDRRQRSIVGPTIVLVAALAVALLDGTSSLAGAVRDPLDEESLVKVGAVLVAILAALGMMTNLLRPSGAAPGPGSPTGGAVPLPTADAEGPSPSSRFPTPPPARPLTPTAKPIGGGGSGRFRALLVAIGLLVAVSSALPQLPGGGGGGTDDGPDPRFTFGEQSASDGPCPTPPDGSSPIDDERSDCLPLPLDEAFPDERTVVEGTPYVQLARDETNRCSSIGATPAARDALGSCTRALRATYASADGSVLGSASIMVFARRSMAEGARDAVSSGPGIRVSSIDTPRSSRVPGLPPSLDRLDPLQGCFATGRYLSCATAAPTGRTPSAEERTAASTAIGDLARLATDVVVARSLRSS